MKLNSRFSNYGVRITLLVCFLLYGFLCISQDCDPKELANIPGVYKGPGKGSVSGIAKTDLAQQQAITKKFTKMVMENYSPKGMNISYGAAQFSPAYYKPNGLNTGTHYNSNFFMMYFYCNHNNKMEQTAETHSLLEFEVNGWKYPSSFFVRQEINEEDPETDVFTTIKYKPVWNENGYWTMTDTVYTSRDMTHFHYLVTKNKQLPFVYVTKKEFLEQLRVYYEKEIQVILETWKNPTPEYAEYAKSSIDQDKSFYGNSIQYIDEFLANSPEKVLNETATVVGGGPPPSFEGFKNYGEWMIKPNPAYYDSKAPKYTPHFIDVLFTIFEPNVACMNAKNDILKIIDFKALQEIVDKGGVQAATGNAPAAKPVVKPAANPIKK